MSTNLEQITTHLRVLDEADPKFHLRQAVASFLFMVMPIDGHSHPTERERLKRILSDDFDLSDSETAELINAAEAASLDKEGMEATADILKAGFNRSELLILVSHMWEMVFADGRMHESEILLVERVAALLGIAPKEVARAMVL